MVAISSVSPMKATRRWPCPSRWAVACRAPATSSSITLSALIPRGGRSTKTTGVRESQGFKYDWSREIGVAIRPANRLPSRASSPGRSPASSSPRLVTMTALPRALATVSTPWVSAAKNGSEMSGTATPIALSLPLRKVRAKRVRHVLQLGDRAFDAEPDLLGDVAVVPQHPRDGLGADPRHRRDLTHRAQRSRSDPAHGRTDGRQECPAMSPVTTVAKNLAMSPVTYARYMP